MKNYLGSIITQLPQIDQPLISLRINQPDGILVRSSWNRSLKQEIAMGAVYNPVTVGLLAAMAIPAFEKVREASQNRASPDQAVLNNLRQFANAGSQFCLDRGVITATYNDLVGPGKYIRVMTPVAGEDYRTLRFTMGQPLQIRLANGRVVELKP
jgi:type IV pilus assembly protein PilA